MTLLSWRDVVEGGAALPHRPVALTIGVFDGVHLGHRRLMTEVTRARALPMVLTFRRTPAAALASRSTAAPILSVAQKLRRIEALGIEAVALIDFSEDFGTLSGRAFIELLRGRLAIESLVVGPNFRFGRNRDADVHALGQMLAGTATTLAVVDPVLYRGEPVSSSRIRRAVAGGFLGEAADMLAADHEIDLAGLTPARRQPGVLSFDRSSVEQVLPPPGEWRGRVTGVGGTAVGTLAIGPESLEVRSAAELPVHSFAFERSD